MRTRLLLLLAILAAGCESEVSNSSLPAPAAPAIGTAYDAAKCGGITGRVTWNGPTPTPPDFPNHIPQADGTFLYHTAKNPNAPQIDPKFHGLGGAVVMLQGVDPATAHPWDLPPVAIEMGDKQIVVVQGGQRRKVGFVRRGDSISVSSTDSTYHVLRGRGGAFFSLTLPEPDKPVTRTLNAGGRIELSSGAGLYWVRADLFVVDHPYIAITDVEGRFEINRVPAGPLRLVVWHPGWDAARLERDPDSTIITRMVYSPPVERVTPIEVIAGRTIETLVSVP